MRRYCITIGQNYVIKSNQTTYRIKIFDENFQIPAAKVKRLSETFLNNNVIVKKK